MASYNTDQAEFTKMQEDALRRLRDMQARSRSMVGAPPLQEEEPPTPSQENKSEEQNVHKPQASYANSRRPNNSLQDLIKSILGDGIKLDTDRAIILMLLYVLYKNKADTKLLIALGYLML